MTAESTEILFISDLHLTAELPATVELFLQFVQQRAIHASALYILGDFFEYWLGDDDPAEDLDKVFTAFELLKERNIPVYVMHGNRDFLLHEGFETRTHSSIIPDPCVIQVTDIEIVLTHGDVLCTDDIKYQAFKKIIRTNEWKDEFLGKPLSERQAIVNSLRETSRSETAQKNEYIMDVNREAVLDMFSSTGCNWIIHGHTHRPGIHHYQDGETMLTRIVLGDWHEHGSVLSVKIPPESDHFEFELETFH